MTRRISIFGSTGSIGESTIDLIARDPDGDWERLNTLANEEQELRARLERRYAEWERVSKVLEAED